MHAEHRLALALGAVDTRAALGDDEDAARRQLIRAGEAMVDAGLAIVLNEAGTKKPMCTLIAREAKRADQDAIDAAATQGDPNAHQRKHACGLHHVITERRDATRILTRIAKRQRFNIGVHVHRSRVLIVDLDTASQVKKFQLRCGEERPNGLTVRSPGARDSDGTWVHRDGGHIWFDVPETIELPLSTGIYKDPDAGWVAMWGDQQVLVPPSVRPEGAYVLEGSTQPLPQWLLDVITTESIAVQERRAESARRRERRVARGETSEIDEWAVRTPWAEILLPDGWVETGLIDRCGCPIWTAPGEHASPKSATAHEPGCEKYSCEVGHGPLHVWTDNPGEAVEAAVRAYRNRTLTKLQVLTWTQGAGQMGRTCDELGIERPGPTVISAPLVTWNDDSPVVPKTAEPTVPTASNNLSETRSPDYSGYDVTDDSEDDPDISVDPSSVDEINDLSPRKVDEISYDEQMIRKEFQRIHWQEAARQRWEAARTPPLRRWDLDMFLDAPRPDPLVPGMLYRDSLARMYGPPGGGKSFLAVDLALSVACGLSWNGAKLARERVVYVMAEGQRVNGDRVEAWLSRHHRDREDVRGWFYAVPEAVKLTETSVKELADWVAELGAGLVVLDTKNAMMVGEENSASDFAQMRRALDILRTAAGCCVLLIDHTGYEGMRARGSSAGTAAMDTEIRVLKDDDSRPSTVTAELTRDKAGEDGASWAWRLVPEHPAAVLDPDPNARPVKSVPEWMTSKMAVPQDVVDYDGPGAKAVEDLARMMMFETIPRHDRSQIGRSFAEAVREMQLVTPHGRMTVQRAWSALKDLGHLGSIFEEPTPTQERSGPHVWSGPIGTPVGPRSVASESPSEGSETGGSE